MCKNGKEGGSENRVSVFRNNLNINKLILILWTRHISPSNLSLGLGQWMIEILKSVRRIDGDTDLQNGTFCPYYLL